MKLRALSMMTALALCGYATASWSSEYSDELDLTKLSLQELLSLEVTIASKDKDSLSNAPSSVTVFRREELVAMGITSLEEMLNFVPGFQATRDVEQGTADRIGSRGRSSAASESVLVLVDGQRLNDLYFGGATVLNRRISVSQVKQIEIIRGPGSALYGSNAFLGVINIVTDTELNQATARVGSQGTKAFNGNISQGWGDLRISSYFSAYTDSGYSFKGVTDALGQTADTRDPEQGLDGILNLQFRGLHLNLRYMERRFDEFIGFGILQNGLNRDLTRQTSALVGYDRDFFEERLHVSAGLAGNLEQWRSMPVAVPAGGALPDGSFLPYTFRAGPTLDSNGWRAFVDARYRLTHSNQLSAGSTFDRSKLTRFASTATGDLATLAPTAYPQNYSGDLGFNSGLPRRFVGFYLQDRQDLAQVVHLTAGLRYDHYSDFGASWNPRAAVVWDTPISSTVRLGYGRAFRAPSYLELYDRNNQVDFGNGALKPESVQTLELAYSQRFRRFNGSVVAFANRLSNLITLGTPVTDPANYLNAPTWTNNGAVQTMRGLELELNAQPVDPLTMKVTLTHLFDTRELLMAPTFGSFIANYRLWRFNINLNGLWRSRSELVPGQGAYAVANFAVQCELMQKLWIQGAVKNLGNLEYRTPTTMAVPGGVPNRGRTFFVGLEYRT